MVKIFKMFNWKIFEMFNSEIFPYNVLVNTPLYLGLSQPDSLSSVKWTIFHFSGNYRDHVTLPQAGRSLVETILNSASDWLAMKPYWVSISKPIYWYQIVCPSLSPADWPRGGSRTFTVSFWHQILYNSTIDPWNEHGSKPHAIKTQRKAFMA